jgi:hypothetical protein
MSDDDDIVLSDGRPSRLHIVPPMRAGGCPVTGSSRAFPPISAGSWKDAEIISPLPPDIHLILLGREQDRRKAS